MFKVALDSFRLSLNAAQVPGGGLDQLQLGARRHSLGDSWLQVRVGHFFGIELWAVAGQVEHFGFAHRLLRREASACQVLANRLHRQLHANARVDQLRHRSARPNRVGQLQLVRRLLLNEHAEE